MTTMKEEKKMADTMKAIWWTEPKKIELLHDVPIPVVKPNMVKVKMAYAALCATDFHQVSMGVMNAKFVQPRPMGHEGCGVIMEMGEGTENSGLKVGDKVALCGGYRCGQCPNCKRGLPSCLNPIFGGSGTFAEYNVAGVTGLHKIPDDAEIMPYAIAEPLGCILRCMDLSPISNGQSVLVSGVGAIGSILLDMVIKSGAVKVTVSDPVPEKRALALAMGAQYVIDPLNEDLVARGREITNGYGYDHVFEASGVPVTAQPCLDLIGRVGTVTYFAVFPPTYEMPVNLHELYMKEGRIQTVFTHPTITPRAIDLIPRMQTDRIIGKVYDLTDGMEAIEMFHKSIYPKILLKCN
jgi:(R,R)-butanediol dehydrogenase/meso-butanediol dehydrogenase/diacetyl reductase